MFDSTLVHVSSKTEESVNKIVVPTDLSMGSSLQQRLAAVMLGPGFSMFTVSLPMARLPQVVVLVAVSSLQNNLSNLSWPAREQTRERAGPRRGLCRLLPPVG